MDQIKFFLTFLSYLKQLKVWSAGGARGEALWYNSKWFLLCVLTLTLLRVTLLARLKTLSEMKFKGNRN